MVGNFVFRHIGTYQYQAVRAGAVVGAAEVAAVNKIIARRADIVREVAALVRPAVNRR